jgi:hypothetical protein
MPGGAGVGAHHAEARRAGSELRPHPHSLLAHPDAGTVIGHLTGRVIWPQP